MKKFIFTLFGSLLGLNAETSTSEATSPLIHLDDVEKIQVLAKVILREEYGKFDEYLNVLKSSDSSHVDYDGESYQNPYAVEVDHSAHGFEQLFLFKTYYETSHIEMIDWVGEEDEDQFVNFLNTQLARHNFKKLSLAKWNTTSDALLSNPNLEAGDYIIEQFRFFSEELSKVGFELLFINNDSDQYFPFVVTKHDYHRINGLTISSISVQKNIP